MSLEIQQGRAKIPGYWISDYILRRPNQPRELILLLHGYTETGGQIYDRLNTYFPEDVALLAPCGPFLIPQRKGGDTRKVEHELGYSWYFYNYKTDEYIWGMDSAIQYLKGLIEILNLNQLPMRIIGFSQGGYLAPFVGLNMVQTVHVIGIASRYLEDEFPEIPHFRMDAVHGEIDEVIDCKASEESHRRLLQKGVTGEFRIVPQVAHRLTFEMREQVKQLVLGFPHAGK